MGYSQGLEDDLKVGDKFWCWDLGGEIRTAKALIVYRTSVITENWLMLDHKHCFESKSQATAYMQDYLDGLCECKDCLKKM
jgi:hypothetical protein